MFSLVAVLMLLMWTSLPAYGHTLNGRVVGGGQDHSIWVVAVGSRNLQGPENILGKSRVDPKSGLFSISELSVSKLYLIVTVDCVSSVIDAGDLNGCRLLFPRIASIDPSSDKTYELQIPDLKKAQAIWRGDTASEGPHRSAGFAFLVLLVLAGVWLLRQKQKQPTHVLGDGLSLPRQPLPNLAVRWAPLVLILISSALYLLYLGREALDLLEYSYFHEGLRPTSFSAVVSDFISAELAHGPVAPLIHRGLSLFSIDPFVLRLPSALFGLLFVLSVFAIVRRELNLRVAIAAALLTLSAPIVVFYARDATPYALAGLCASASIWTLLRARDSQSSWPWWLAFSALQVLGFFSHYAFAFVSAGLFLAITIAWWRPHKRLLGRAYLAFAFAGLFPVLVAPHLVHMIESSGIRFALMSPVYPESPGLLSFGATFLTVLTTLPHDWAWGLLFTLPLWVMGMRMLFRHAPLLAWIVGAQALFIVLFLTFSHSMSTEVGGGHIFYAFRWTRPLLLGALLPLSMIAITRARWLLIILIVGAFWQSLQMINNPLRPAQQEAVSMVHQALETGDAYAVLPAAFYGDPLQYNLSGGQREFMITQMRAQPLAIGDGLLSIGRPCWGSPSLIPRWLVKVSVGSIKTTPNSNVTNWRF